MRLKRVILYTLSITIGIWGVVLLYFSAKPNITQSYKLYYLDHKLMNWSGYRGLDYKLGTRVFFSQDSVRKEQGTFYLGKNWNNIENWGVWSKETGDLFFVLDHSPENDLSLILNATFFVPDNNQEVTILANDKVIDKWILQNEENGEYQLAIPHEIVGRQNLIHMQFVIRNAKSPKEVGRGEDGRVLGIGLRWMELH
ncbi:hypothetical protein [Gorillibacterium sp. sgz500922]|uniref:hypothetical protein n=1 Tax=Gorillibacterium sp. sgz500922 TaxID=3446694 RepID=UPI003F668F0C